MKKQKSKLSSEQAIVLMLAIGGMASLIVLVLSTLFFKHQMAKIPMVSQQTGKVYSTYYALIVQDTKDSFWQSVYKEAKEEGKKQDIYVELLGDDLLERYSITDKFKMALASKVDGIMVAPDGEDLEDVLEEADQMGIPVVTLLNDSLKGERKSFIGVNSHDIAKLYWHEIQTMDRPIHKVLILIDEEEQMSNKNMMYLSIKKTLESQGLQVEVKPIDRNNIFSAEEVIRNIVLNPAVIPDLLICLNMDDTLCAYQDMIDYNKVGEVAIMGYYQSDVLLEGISKGIINATLSIDTKQMGMQGVDALYRYETDHRVNAYFTVAVNMIDKNNLGLFSSSQP